MGSFQIVAKIGKVAYKLQLHKDSHIHPIFHSLLKLFHQASSFAIGPAKLPAMDVDHKPLITPLAIIDTCWDIIKFGQRLVVLVQWKGLHLDDTSWEDWKTLKDTYHLENKVLFKGLVDDRPKDTDLEDTRSRPIRRTNPVSERLCLKQVANSVKGIMCWPARIG